MKPQGPHAVLAQQTAEEAERERCVASMRRFFSTELIAGNRELYRTCVLPQFVERHGREPSSASEVRDALGTTFYYRASSLIGRATQELLWDTVGESVERQIEDLSEKAKSITAPVGSLTLDPELPMPDYIEAVDIHVMPGNFHTELGEDDLLAGALYDRGAYIFAYGSRGAYNDNLGRVAAQMIKERFPGFSPTRILEMGCGCGSSTLPLKAAWPDAEVHAIDIGAPMLRYAHARAESLGVSIHFSQQDASRTQFPDQSFDLVISIIVLHEMPLNVIHDMLKECHRLLRPGGITLHDGGRPADAPPPDAFQQFLSSWFARNNNEPFGVGHELERDLVTAGFALEDMFAGSPSGDEYLKGHIAAHHYIGAVKR